jgi:DNA adenine methylase
MGGTSFAACTSEVLGSGSTDKRSAVTDNVPQHRPSRRLRSPLVWFGGKGILARKIVSLFPPHHTYVEPFCGGASCLFAKPPSPVEVINDLDSDIVNFFRVLRDPEKFERFHRLAALTPYSREEFVRYRCNWRARWQECPDEVERAYRWYVVARMSFAGEFARSWGRSVGTSRLGMANAVAQWLSIVDMLPAIAERFRSVQIEHGDWLDVLESYDTPNTLFYVDPPFVQNTRSGGKYQHEIDNDEHRELVEALLCIQGRAVLSGYRNPIYLPLEEADWKCVDLPTLCFAAGRTRLTALQGAGSLTKFATRHLRTETLWISPATPAPCSRLAGRRFSRFRKSNRYMQGMFDFALES